MASNNVYQKFLKSGISLSPFGILDVGTIDFYPYFCTPKGAKIIGRTGSDGVHYCFVRGFKDTVFVVIPMNTPNEYVKPVARCFSDFLSLLISCKDESLVADAGYISSQAFADRLKESGDEADDAAAEIETKLGIHPMQNPQEYIKKLQSEFDYSKLKFTEDYYDIDMNPNAPCEDKWEVYFNRGFGSARSGERPAKEVPLGVNFEFSGKQWLIPSMYICSKGIVVDIIAQTDMSEFDAFYAKYKNDIESSERLSDDRFEFVLSQNPVSIDVNISLSINGKPAITRGINGMVWVSIDESIDCKRIIEHYSLDSSKAMDIKRASFKWATKSKPRVISDLEIKLGMAPKIIRGKEFCVSGSGQSFEIKNPLTGTMHMLTVDEFDKQSLKGAAIENSECYIPNNYISIYYTLSPEIDKKTVRIHDVCQSDSPKARFNPSDRFLPDAHNSASIGIIGGADGPTAILIGSEPHQICSSLHFEPQDSVTLRADFTDLNQPSISLKLIDQSIKA